MYGYAASAAEAVALEAFSEPPQTAKPSGPSLQTAAVAQATGSITQTELPQLMSAVPATLQEISSPAAASPFDALPQTGLLADILNFLDGNDGNPYGIFFNSNLVNGFTSAGYTAPGAILPAITGAIADINSVALGDGPAASSTSAGSTAALNAGAMVTQPGVGGVTAGTNQAALVGRLSVPPSWTAAVEAATNAGNPVTSAGLTGTAAVPEASTVPGLPGMPGAGVYARSFGSGPRYGFQPTIMTRPPSGG